MTAVDETPVTAAVDLSADGGLDAAGNWHDTDGRFAPKGKRTAKYLAAKAADVLRGVLAAAAAKANDDGADLDVDPDHPLAAKLGHRARVRWHDDKHGIVDIDGRRVMVPWNAFVDPVPAGHDHVDVPDPDAPDAADSPVYFHASAHEFKPGDTVTPGAARGGRGEHAYAVRGGTATTPVDHALREAAAEADNQGAGRHVYQVEPITDDLTDDPAYDSFSPGTSVRSKAGFRVVGPPRPEHQKIIDDHLAAIDAAGDSNDMAPRPAGRTISAETVGPDGPDPGGRTVTPGDAPASPAPGFDSNDLTGAEIGGHQPSYGPGAHELTHRPDYMPTDALEHPTWYTGADRATLAETERQLRAADGKPDAQVTIYRAVRPEVAAKGVDEVFDEGNWVTLSRAYADQHAMQDEGPDWPVLSKTVPARTVRFAGDDLMEWGYFPNGDPDPDSEWVETPGDTNDLTGGALTPEQRKQMLADLDAATRSGAAAARAAAEAERAAAVARGEAFDEKAYDKATADASFAPAFEALARFTGQDDSAPLDYYSRVSAEARRLTRGAERSRDPYEAQAQTLLDGIAASPPAGIALWRADAGTYQPGDTVTFPLVSVTPDLDYAKVYADPNLGQGTKRAMLEFPADTKYLGLRTRMGDHEGVTTGTFRVAEVTPGPPDINGNDTLPTVRLEHVPAVDTNDLAVAPDDRAADYVTPAVERWAERFAEGMDNPKQGEILTRSLQAWRDDPSEATAQALFRTLTEGAGTRRWIEDTLASPTPDPDAVSTLRMIHSATVYEMGNRPHRFSRTNNHPDAPFAPGGFGEAIAAAPPTVVSWVRADPGDPPSNPGVFGAHEHTAEFGPDRVLANAGGQAAIGEYLIASDPETIPRLMRGDFPAARPAVERNDLLLAPPRPATAPDTPELDLPAPTLPPGLEAAETTARAAVDRLFDIHHTDVGINGVDLPTLPTVSNGERFRGQPMDPATQRLALEALFRPAVDDKHLYFHPLTVVDETPANRHEPIRSVAVNVDTGEIVGSHAPWQPGPAGVPPYGRWASLPADHPQAPDMVTAAWLASPEAKRYLTEQLYPRLRDGRYPIDPVFPGLTETVRRQADDIASTYRGHADIEVRRVNGPDGTYYVPDPDGRVTIHGDDIHFADFDEDGGLRLWVRPDLAHEADVRPELDGIDYSTVDDPDVPWEDRVAALAEIRRKLTDTFGPTPSELFSSPTEADLEDLYNGNGGEREMAYLAALGRFGESLETLVSERRATLARQPDKRAVLDKLAELPNVPPPLAELLAREDWDYTIVGPTVPTSSGALNGGGYIDIRFPDHPDSAVAIFTSARTNTTQVGWEFSGHHRLALGEQTFAGWSPSGRVSVPADRVPGEWYESLREPGGPVVSIRTGENTPEMSAWLDTMTALGVDMSTDDTLWFAEGRDVVAERSGDPARGAVPVQAKDLDGTLARTVDVGLRPYPRAWTETLGGKLNRVAIDPTRYDHEGTSSHFPEVSVIDVPSIDVHPDYADVPTHEFAHVFERGVDGLMLIETWHFIQRLRRERAKRDRFSTWTWKPRPDGKGLDRRVSTDADAAWKDAPYYGYRDEFGDEYMGRVYRSGYTGIEGVTAAAGHEIFSTVAQTLWANDYRNRPDLDPEARRLFMALLAVIDPARPRRWKP